MNITHGADVAGLRAFGEVLAQRAQQVERIVTEVQAGIRRGEAWRGRDADEFRTDWASVVRPRLQRGARALEKAALDIRRQADQQEQASAADGAIAGAPGADEARYNKTPQKPPDDPNDLGTLDPQIVAEWENIPEDERLWILTQLAKELGAEFDITDVKVKVDEDISTYAEWRERTGFRAEEYEGGPRPWQWGHTLALSPDIMDDPTEAFYAIGHEMRHAAQHEMVRDTYPPLWYEWWGWGEDPWHYTDVTKEDARKWEWEFANPVDPFRVDEYAEQATEIDARQGGRDFVNNLTYEQLMEYRDQYPG